MLSHPKRTRVYTPLSEKLVTKQSHQAECDIYNILKQYQRTGIITHIAARQPSFQDMPDPVDYQEALHHIQRAEAAFDALPASVRDHFRNSPQAFLDAFGDQAQHDKLRELGLLNPKSDASAKDEVSRDPPPGASA